jgi:hypothetical protein
VVHEFLERRRSDAALADRLVAVDPRTERLLRVVGMDHDEPAEADRAVESVERFVKLPSRMERIAGGEDVAGVEADPDAFRKRFHAIDATEHRGDLIERGPEAGSLARGGFDEHARPHASRSAERFRDAVGGPCHGLVDVGPARGARMGHDPRDPELLGPREFLGQSGDRLFAKIDVRGCRIDEIGIVGHDGREPRLCDRRAEGRGVLWSDRRRVPLVDVSREDLKAFAAGLDRPLDRLRESAGDRLVGAEGCRGGLSGGAWSISASADLTRLVAEKRGMQAWNLDRSWIRRTL